MKLTNTEYEALSTMFHEFHTAFCALPVGIRSQYYERLYKRH